MKTILVSTRSREIKQLLELAQEGDVLVQTSGGTEFVLSFVDDFDLEIVRQRRNRKLMAFLDARFRQARRQKRIPLGEVIKQLGLDNGSKHDGKNARRKTRQNPR